MTDIPHPGDPRYNAASERMRSNGGQERKMEEPDRVVRVYVCPRCPNYYGSSSMGKLEDKVNFGTVGSDRMGEEVSRRSQCPDCGTEREVRYARLVPEKDVKAAIRKVTAAIR